MSLRQFVAVVLVVTTIGVVGGRTCHAQAGPAEPGVALDVQCDKLCLLPGETQFATITAHNGGPEAAHLQVVVTLHYGLTDSRPLGQIALAAPADGTAQEVIAFPAGPQLFGYEVRAEAPGVGRASAFFSVHHNLWKVAILGNGLHSHAPQSPLTTEAEREQMVSTARNTLCNHVEFFAWAPDDFSELNPRTETWYAGQTSYPASKLGLHAAIDALHSVGATTSAYAKGQMGGPPAFDFFRRHPQWTGAPYNSQWSVLDIKEFKTKSPLNMGPQAWPRAMTDFGAWPIAQWHIDQLHQSAQEFGFDGVRYDDQLQVGWVNEGYNAMTARNMEQIVKQLRQELPYYGFGFNWILGSTRQVWDRHQGQPFPDWPAAGTAGSQIMDEEIGQIYGSSRPAAGLPWSSYKDRLRYDRGLVEPYGGQVYVMQNQELSPLDSAYRNALVFASRLHHTNYDAAAPGHFARFATRYGALLWPDKPIDIAADKVRLSADRDLWGNDMAYRYQLDPRHGRVVVHIINPPSNANLGAPRDIAQKAPPRFPAPAADVELQLSLPKGWQAERAMAVDAVTMDSSALPAVGTDVKLQIPTVTAWTVVAIDCRIEK